MQKFFFILGLIICGKCSQRYNNIKVFLQPLMDELLHLWKAVWAYDVTKPKGQQKFLLRTAILWTLYDYTAYGLIFR
jgi:hypothetical protein